MAVGSASAGADATGAPAVGPAAIIGPLSDREAHWGLAAALAWFTILAWYRLVVHRYPFYDDVAYLDAASRIHESGGVLALVRHLFDGSWPEENRNPLYLGLLSVVAGRDVAFHQRAQALGLALGGLSIVAAYWCARRLFDARTAVVLSFLLASSETLLAWSSREACEPLLVIFAALAFERLLRERPSLVSFALAGAFSGLAWLTKGTGIFIAFSACLAIAWEERRRLGAMLTCGACLVAGFVATASPLLVRNLVRFHAPLHNYNDRFLWIDPLDDFSEIYAPGALERLDRGPLAYFRALTPARALLRIGRGLAETTAHLGDSMSLASPKPFGAVHIAWIAVGVVAAIASVRLVAGRRAILGRGFARTFFLAHAAFNFAFFVFYNAVSGSSRYLMPLALTLLLPLAKALADRIAASPAHPRWWVPRFRREAWPAFVLCACGAAPLLACALGPTPRESVRPAYEAAFAAIRAQVAPGEVFAIDARSRLQPYWAMDPHTKMETLSTSWDGKLLPDEELLQAMRARGVHWIVLDGTSRKDDAPRWFFSQEAPLASDGSLVLEHLPAGLRVAWTSETAPRQYALLELVR